MKKNKVNRRRYRQISNDNKEGGHSRDSHHKFVFVSRNCKHPPLPLLTPFRHSPLMTTVYNYFTSIQFCLSSLLMSSSVVPSPREQCAMKTTRTS